MSIDRRLTPRRSIALALAACLSLWGCNSAPVATSLPPSPAPSAVASPAAGTAAPSAATNGPALADELSAAIDPAAILDDLERLLEITNQHGGARPAGSDAEAAAVAFVADELRNAGLSVELQPVEVALFTQDEPSVLEIPPGDGGTPAFEDVRDYKAMLFSASGDVTAPVYALGFNPGAAPGDRNGLGCEPSDWAAVPSDVIVLVQPASCRRHDVVVRAQQAGAVAIVTSYAEWKRDAVLRPTLVTPGDIEIPVLGATHEVGLALAQAAEDGVDVRVATRTTVELRMSANVIGESPGGDPAHVVMLGGHLDSVVDGPGINDNGSGTMTILEIARRLLAITAAAGGGDQAWKLRVAFWTGEETGLWGSGAYVGSLDRAASGAIEAYLNFDMLGSANGVRLVYDGADTSRPVEGAAVTALFGRAFDGAGLAWEPASLGGSSDHFVFDRAGIVTGGLFSGANEHKSAAHVGIFGGTADAPEDACYHLACDTVDNIDATLLGQMAGAAAWVTGGLASGEVDLEGK